ncbi:hypothetical protein LOK74_22880 [Brevibacillus humidisoli]|uniref:hypothetical protein n=1 Tax=Brevibacillus humidisoli TaxID=2895522 RepID=UPI001E429328|nr:hypothetical protein [Brevibacillus humidisoli]UFJ40802.1 hypothetical protein LOK74_22880 [Brevibacillus humidisoli]
MISQRASARIMRWGVILFTIFICFIGPYLINETKLSPDLIDMVYWGALILVSLALVQAVIFDFLRGDKAYALKMIILHVVGIMLINYLL